MAQVFCPACGYKYGQQVTDPAEVIGVSCPGCSVKVRAGGPTPGLTMGEAMRMAAIPAESIASCFHRHYERLAPEYGYKTREASAVPWEDVPEESKSLMCATVRAVVAELGLFTREELKASLYAEPKKIRFIGPGAKEIAEEATAYARGAVLISIGAAILAVISILSRWLR